MSPARASASPGRIMIVDDDPTVAGIVARYLERDGYEVVEAHDGLAALELAESSKPDLVVLDVMLPYVDGLEVCRRLRSSGSIPIIMLSARGHETDRVVGLELGADDYLAKPFSPRELTARIRSVLRRANSGPAADTDGGSDRISAGHLDIDMAGREVRVHGLSVSLTVREFELLAFLAGRPGRVFTRQVLLERVWGYSFGDTTTVTVHIRRLREKVEDEPSDPQMIETVWGVGYRFRRPGLDPTQPANDAS
jgi:two-component system, OmpR family, response regulator ResD